MGGGLAYGQSNPAGSRIAATPSTPNPSLSGRGIGDTSRLGTADNLHKAGEQFEAVFTGMMLKAMRATHLADPLFDSKALDTFRDMQDQTTVKAMAAHTPLGIGKAMTDFLAKGASAPADQASAAEPAVNPPPSSAAR